MTTPDPTSDALIGDVREDAHPLDLGDWIIGHPGELVATFLLPCPDPLPLADGEVLPTYKRLEQAMIELLEPQLDDLWLRSTDAPIAVAATAMRPPNQGNDESAHAEPPVMNWSNKHLLNTSIQVHQTFNDAALRVGLEPAMQLAEVVGGSMLSAEQREAAVAQAAEATTSATSPMSELRDLGFGSVSVAEIYVALRIVGNIPDLVSPLVHDYPDEPPFGPAAPDRVYPDENAMWHWRVFPAGTTPPPDLVEQRLRNALDIALTDLRSIQRATHALRRAPTSLSTLQRLPFVIPVLLRTTGQIGNDEAPSWTGLLATRPNLDADLAPEPLDPASIAAFNRTRQRLDNGAFSAHVDLHRDGHHALERSGDYRLAALLFGIAAESLLDELMLHLMWEEAKTPEEVADAWFDGLDRRVRENLQHRLGGPWDLTKRNPVGAWAQDVAALRHRVAHAGYTPTKDEAHASFDALNGLVTHLCDRLATQNNLRTYPRTALTLAGQSGLMRRNTYTARIRALEEDTSEVDWVETFTRWREAWRRLRQDKTAPRIPDLDEAWLLAVLHPDKPPRWIKHDRTQHLAIEVAHPTDIPEWLMTQIHDLADRLTTQGQTTPVSMGIKQGVRSTPKQGSTWVEQYHHVPMTEVMVDGSDHTQQTGAGIPV